MKYPAHLIHLINTLKRLPGVGSKTAERYAFNMLEWQKTHLHEVADAIRDLCSKVRLCPDCGSLAEENNCFFCTDDRSEAGVICVVANPKEVFSIELTGEFKGLYHVLGGLLSPLDGIGPEALALPKLKHRIEMHNIREVVIGLDATLEGDATTLYLKRELSSYNIKISRLALGLPIGSSLDYIDGGTIARAFVGRNTL